MDFSLGCQNRCRQQDGFQSRVPKTGQATGWISVYGAKNGTGNRMDFSLGCPNRCRQQDGFQSRVSKTGQAKRMDFSLGG